MTTPDTKPEPKSEGAFLDTRNALEGRMTTFAKRLPHPNIITGRIRTSLAALGLPLHTVSPILGTVSYSLNLACDWFDGMSARVNNQRTREGEKLDPLVDKVTNAAYLVYLSILHINDISVAIASAANIAVDAASQLQRGNPVDQAKEAVHATLHPHDCEHIDPVTEGVNRVKANTFGKIKMMLQSAAIVAMLVSDEEATQTGAVAALGASAVVGAIGTAKRMFHKK